MFEEIMSEIFPKLEKEKDIWLQEVHRVPNKINSYRPTPRPSKIKMAQVKENILKAQREKQSHAQEKSHRVMS